MRIRTIKPEFWSSEGVAGVSIPARLTFIGLWNCADDHGTGKANPGLVKASLFPLDGSVSPDDVETWLTELESLGLISRYVTDDRAYYRIPSWEKHQAAAYRRGEPQHPAPTSEQLAPPVVQMRAGTGNREQGVEQGTGKGTDIAPRKRDALFEAVAEACGIDWQNLTPSSRGALNKSVAQLRGVGAEPDDVRYRASNWPYDVPLTPPGLAKHWPALANVRASPSAKTRRTLALAERLELEGR